MRKKSLNLLKNKTIIWIVTSMALAFIVTAASLMFYFTNLIRDDFTNSISISAEKKVLELNYFFNSAD